MPFSALEFVGESAFGSLGQNENGTQVWDSVVELAKIDAQSRAN